MKVKTVLRLAAANLGRDDLVAQINDCAAEPTGDLSALLRCFNLVENEIALDYFPLTREQRLCAPNGVIPLHRLRETPVGVLGVEDAEGRKLSFEVHPAAIRLPAYGGRGRVTVRYTYSPREKCLMGDSDFSGRISARLLALGVTCEFCLSHGSFAEAATWEKKYREALRAANIVRKRLSVRARRWI